MKITCEWHPFGDKPVFKMLQVLKMNRTECLKMNKMCYLGVLIS